MTQGATLNDQARPISHVNGEQPHEQPTQIREQRRVAPRARARDPHRPAARGRGAGIDNVHHERQDIPYYEVHPCVERDIRRGQHDRESDLKSKG